MIICLGEVQFEYGPTDATATQSPALVSPDWFYLLAFTFLVLACLGSPRQNAGSRKTVVVVLVVVVVVVVVVLDPV